MKHVKKIATVTLTKKFVICYILIAIFMFTLLNTYGVHKLNTNLIENKKDVLYSEANLISTEYVSNYYKEELTLSSLVTQLKTIDTFLNTRIWLVGRDGYVIADTKQSSAVNINVNDYDADFLTHSSSNYTIFEGIFTEPMLSVVLPVSVNFETKGYIVMHTSLNHIKQESIYYMDIFNLCFLIFLVLMFFVFLYIYYATVRPAKKLIRAAKEYSSGHYDYPLKVNSHDELEELATAICFMAEEINSLDEYQKKFVANISHDFRSPLTSIKGYTVAMLDGTIPYEMQGKYLNIILFETERLTKLTSNLLELNSFENNGTLLNITSFDIKEIIKRTAESFEGICTEKKLIINLLFEEGTLFVDADIDKVQQVLYNLLDNAIKFSHDNSSIKISSEEKGDKVFISVKDYGIGIPKESIKKIWERFYKTDSSRGKDKKGTGLGLSITKEIINAHGENINVISTEGVGTEFIFSLTTSKIVSN